MGVEMIFQQYHIDQISSGIKTQTRRSINSIYSVGRSYRVQPGRGKHGLFKIKILKVHLEKLGDISEEDIRAEGHTTLEEFINVWRLINKNYNPNEIVKVIKFEKE